MEIKATLNKPCEEKERLDFIVANNHNLGYQIKETDTALEAWGLTAEEEAQKEKEIQIAEKKAKLVELDEKSVRSVRAKLAGTSTAEDDQFLANLEEQAETLREEIKELQK